MDAPFLRTIEFDDDVGPVGGRRCKPRAESGAFSRLDLLARRMGDPSVNHVAVRTSDRDLQWRNRKCLRSRICDLAVDNQKATVRFDDHSGIGPRYFEFRQVYGQADGFEQNGCPGLGPDNRCSESRAGRKADEHGGSGRQRMPPRRAVCLLRGIRRYAHEASGPGGGTHRIGRFRGRAGRTFRSLDRRHMVNRRLRRRIGRSRHPRRSSRWFVLKTSAFAME